MAIAPLTGFKAFTFDGEKSTDYGVAILGEGVFNAPERDVEMITIPGRSGQFVLDNGRFENIEVTYPANLIADSEADFAEALSDFRNMLCSKRGYVRLQDDYHPDEYRMAVYKSGLEVDEKVLRAGEFEITFDCKPQRWLTSGESAVEVDSGDELTNPTLFEASPMLEIYGYGNLNVNGSDIYLDPSFIGNVELLETGIKKPLPISPANQIMSHKFNSALVNAGDTISLNSNLYSASIGGQGLVHFYGSAFFQCEFECNNIYHFLNSTSTKSGDLDPDLNGSSVHVGSLNNIGTVNGLIPSITFTAGTAITKSGTITAQYTIEDADNNPVETAQVTVSCTLSYDGNDEITVSLQRSIDTDTLGIVSISDTLPNFNVIKRASVMAESTVSVLGNPTYIDCDIGACYKIDNGSIIDLNSYIDLGSNLPVLSSGLNTVTFDNTITSIDIVPRWWKV